MLTLLLALAVQQPLQQPRAGFTRDSVRVGDLVGVSVQVDVSRSTVVGAPDSLDLTGDLENAAPRRLQIDTLADGNLRYRFVYPITAWKPGTLSLPAVTLTLTENAASSSSTLALPQLAVISVLPPDTAGVQPKPPRDVWGASRLWWPIVVLALLILTAIALAIWWYRRRPRKQVEAVPLVPLIMPREWALRELDRLAAEHYIERGEYHRFYIELSGIIRTYLGRLDGTWSSDLTTRELADRLYAARADAAVPIDVLSRADLVKFARQQHGADQAGRDLLGTRKWVDEFSKPLLLAEAA